MGRGESTYTQYYSNFIGADMSSDPRVVARNRLAYSVNMWRDYESEQGAAVETFPGFRRVADFPHKSDFWSSSICGMWSYKGRKKNYLLIHNGDYLHCFDVEELTQAINSISLNMQEIMIDEKKVISYQMSTNSSAAFALNNRFYILNGTNIIEVYEEYVKNEYKVKAKKISKFYTPTTYYNGQPYEQRNGFLNKVLQIDTSGGLDYYKDDSYREFMLYDSYTAEKIIQSDPAGTGTTWTEPKESGIESVYVDNITKLKELDLGTALGQTDTAYLYNYKVTEDGCLITSIIVPKSVIYNEESGRYKTVTIKRKVDAINFNTIGDLREFQNDKVTMAEAILGCTKSAVYDGRVFLTGNPELPNTVFYSQRNLTGANDPTYFGVYNYFNDGDGNTPNVDLLATPSMLMVIKGDTVQDGSVYYHVGADNPHSDKSVRDLVPRIYPSTTGAAGLGSAGYTSARSLSCNFLDDPVFLSRRGLEGVSKEQLNAERTIQHRSSNIDRLLIKENLANASLAEWKGYLVICCNGHIYLADSRVMTQHQDGSYQYEWFYLEGVGTYEEYDGVYSKVTEWPYIDDVSLKDIVGDDYELWDSEGEVKDILYEGVRRVESVTIQDINVYYYNDVTPTGKVIKRVLDVIPDKKVGTGEFYGAKRVLAVGELLIFATDYDICIFNTDKRGVPIKDDNGEILREVDSDKIDPSWYSFNGVPYRSALALRLDDCDKKALTKTTIYGTTVARLKMMPGSKCRIKTSENGRDWEEIAEAHSTRTDLSDLRFDNLSFAEDEDDITVMPEHSRGWVSKQYYFESDGFCEPFGLYELSYIYKIAGKIRYL